MEHGRHTSKPPADPSKPRVRIRIAAWLTVLAAAAAGAAQAQDRAPASASCVSKIAAVLADIAARDLDTTEGPPLNAFLALNPSALAQAEALDRGEQRGPLFCVPVAVKDNFDTYDMPTTAGSLALLGNQPPDDAPFVRRLRAAGAVIVGKTNMDEFAMGYRGLSGAGGRVGNAYDPRQSAGGSSSGSAVAVGAGYLPFAVGSDNCGSLRIPAAYNGAVTLRATYGRFDTRPIGFVNGAPGVIARDTTALRAALAVAGDGWRADADGDLRGRRIGILQRFDRKDPWAPADADAQELFAQAIARMRQAGAEIVEGVALDEFDARLGPEFLKGFAPRVDAAFATFPAARRDWRDVCTSGRIRPEWNAADCEAAGASSPAREQQAIKQIAGLPAAAFPIGLDARGLPVGLELLGRPQADEALVAMMAAFERTRGPLPPARRTPGRADLARLDIARQNELQLRLGWSAFHSRRGTELGQLAPDRFRALTERQLEAAAAGR